jgi:hypothetical protein
LNYGKLLKTNVKNAKHLSALDRRCAFLCYNLTNCSWWLNDVAFRYRINTGRCFMNFTSTYYFNMIFLHVTPPPHSVSMYIIMNEFKVQQISGNIQHRIFLETSSNRIPSFQNTIFPSLVTVSIEYLPMGSRDGVVIIVPHFMLDGSRF